MSTKFFFEEDQDFLFFLNGKKYSQIIFLVDAKTNGFCEPILRNIFPQFQNTETIIIPDGEQNKNLSVCNLIWEGLIALNADRKTLLINFGGGMVCDMGGFAASTFKRGIDYINIPTTLLAMVDASHGGKTGIDFNQIKNIIGTFQHPVAVYVNPVFLNTVPVHILRSGIAEMLKHALLKGETSFKEMLQMDEKDFYTIEKIKESVLFKKEIVSRDEKDENIRQTLNLGHTIGHAIESFSLNTKKPLLHGEAVILGLIYEMMLSKILFNLAEENIQDVIQFKKRIFPDLNFHFSYSDVEEFIKNDKKNNETIKMSLLQKIGECKWQISVTEEQIKKCIEETNLLLQQ